LGGEPFVLDLERLSGDLTLPFRRFDMGEILAEEVGLNRATGPKTTLEAGCGSGKMSVTLALRSKSFRCLGIDISESAVLYARKLAQAVEHVAEVKIAAGFSRMDFFAADCFAPGQFDYVFNEGTPEHFIDARRQGYFDKCARLAAKKVIIFVPNKDCPEQQEVSTHSHHDYEGTVDYEEDFTRDELRERLLAAHLDKVEVRPVTPGPWEKSRFLVGVGRP